MEIINYKEYKFVWVILKFIILKVYDTNKNYVEYIIISVL